MRGCLIFVSVVVASILLQSLPAACARLPRRRSSRRCRVGILGRVCLRGGRTDPMLPEPKAKQNGDMARQAGLRNRTYPARAEVKSFLKAVHSSNLSLAESQIRSLRRSGKRIPSWMYAGIMEAFAGDRTRPYRADHWHQEMVQDRKSLNKYQYSHIILQLAEHIRDANQLGRWLDRSLRRCNATTQPAIEAAISKLAGKGDFRKAEHWMYQLLDRFHLKPSSEALNAFLQAVAKAKMFGRLQAWSNRIREGMNLTLKEALEPATIHAIILAQEKMKNFDGMVSWFSEVNANDPENPFVSKCYHALIRAYSDRDNWEACYDLLTEVMEKGLEPNADMCSYVVKALILAEKMEEADELMDRMLEVDFIPNAWAFTPYVNWCWKNDQKPRAEAWLQRWKNEKDIYWRDIIRPKDHQLGDSDLDVVYIPRKDYRRENWERKMLQAEARGMLKPESLAEPTEAQIAEMQRNRKDRKIEREKERERLLRQEWESNKIPLKGNSGPLAPPPIANDDKGAVAEDDDDDLDDSAPEAD